MRSRRSDHKGKEEFWRPIFLRFKESGQNCRAFCEAEGFRCSHFGFWRRKFEKEFGTFRGQRTEEQWTKVIEEALRHPGGLLAYLAKQKIDKKTFYKKYSELKNKHPEWGRYPKRSKPQSTDSKLKKSSELQAPPFAEVKVSSPSNAIGSTTDVLELVLPNSITVKIVSGCSLDYVSSLLSVLENR